MLGGSFMRRRITATQQTKNEKQRKNDGLSPVGFQPGPYRASSAWACCPRPPGKGCALPRMRLNAAPAAPSPLGWQEEGESAF